VKPEEKEKKKYARQVASQYTQSVDAYIYIFNVETIVTKLKEAPRQEYSGSIPARDSLFTTSRPAVGLARLLSSGYRGLCPRG
jgi:hypothetical protein